MKPWALSVVKGEHVTVTHQDLLSRDDQNPGILMFGGARMALLDVEAGFWSLRHQLEAMVGRNLADGVFQQAGANGGASFAQAYANRGPADGAQALRECVAAYQAAGFGRFEIEELEWPIGRVTVRGRSTVEAWAAQRHLETPADPTLPAPPAPTQPASWWAS